MSESSAAQSGSAASKKGKGDEPRPFFLKRWGLAIALFVRQVVAELKKVVWPTRSQLFTYTVVVLIFVVAFGILVALLDLGFFKLALAVFG